MREQRKRVVFWLSAVLCVLWVYYAYRVAFTDYDPSDFTIVVLLLLLAWDNLEDVLDYRDYR